MVFHVVGSNKLPNSKGYEQQYCSYFNETIEDYNKKFFYSDQSLVQYH